MRNQLKAAATILLLNCLGIQAQVITEWVKRYNGTDNRFDLANSMHLDATSNIYISGTSSSIGALTDIALLKYNSAGELLWSRLFNGYGNSTDNANASFLDAQGNSYITGFTADTGLVIKNVVLKYNSSGTLLWSRIFLPPGYTQSMGTTIAADINSNVYAGCRMTRINSTIDIGLLKYTADGNLLRSYIYSAGPTTMESLASITVDESGNVFVLGTTNAVSGYDDILLQKYTAELQLVWSITFSGNTVGNDNAVQIIYTPDHRLALACSMFNSSSGFDYGVYRFDTNSVMVGQYIFNGSGNHQDIPYSINCDNANNIYVTGSSRNADSIGSEDIVTLKLNPFASLIWARTFNGAGSGIDYGTSIVTDALRNVYVGGTTDKGSNRVEYAVLKYSQFGVPLWTQKYSMLENSEDFVYSVAVDNSYNVFVTGISFDSTSDYDIATIKYSQPIGIEPVTGTIPKEFELFQNYPNPFNPATKIKFALPNSGKVLLVILDVSGKEIEKLVDQELPAGYYEASWDGALFSSGVYFYTFRWGDYTKSKKMILIK